MANFCPNCGIKVETSWNACPDCGYSLILEKSLPQPSGQQGYQQSPQYSPTVAPQPYPTPYQQRGGNNNGVLALVFGLIGLFCCYGAIVFGPLAIIFGMKGKKTDDDPTLAQLGFILGIINIVCVILMLVLMFVFFGFYFY